MARQQNQTRRRRVPLPDFAPGCTADPDRAWNDRIKLDFRSCGVRVENNANLFQYLLSIYAGGEITKPSQKRGSDRITFKLVKETSLLGAQFVLRPANRRTAVGSGLAEVWNMQITLEVNPTRLFSHFGCRINNLRALRRGYFPIFDEARDQLIRDETLDNSNNHYLDADVRLAINANNQSINEHAIRACLGFVKRVLEPRIPNNGNGNGGVDADWDGAPRRDIRFHYDWDQWAISQLETIFEFDCADAVSTVHAFSRHASEIASGLGETFYAMDNIETGRLTTQHPENAVSLTIPLGQRNTKLVLYAKSPRRVRCEVRHLKNPRSIYNRNPVINSLTTDRLGNMFAAITEINRVSADNRANPFLHELWKRHRRPVGTVVQLTTFLENIASVCENTGVDMLRILPQLIANGRLGGAGSESYKNAIRELVNRGVISPTANRSRSTGRFYAITRPYADVLDQLKTNMRRL